MELHSDIIELVHDVLDIVDGQTPGVTLTMGRVHDDQGFERCVPEEFALEPPAFYKSALRLADVILKLTNIRAIRYGSQTPTLGTYPGVTHGTLLLWLRQDRSTYQV